MLNYIEVTAKTEDEAIAKGLAQLGLDRDDVSVEILDRGRTGFLGIGSVPAKVKLTYETADEPAPAPVEPPKPEVVVPPTPVERRQKPADRPQRKERKNAPARQQERRNAPEHARTAPTPAAEAPTAPAAAEQADPDVVAAIVKFQSGLFSHMGVEATPVVSMDGQVYQVVLEGENMGALIGHRGETLNAIQQLTNYAVNQGRSNRVRVHVDAEGYRARREESLEKLARKTAAKVVKAHRSITLEAMNAYERHVIHTTLQDYPGVTTYSTGVEPNRRTVVACDSGKR